MSVFDHISKQEALDFFKDLVAIESHKACDARESNVVDRIHRVFDSEGIFCEEQAVEPKRNNIYAIIKGMDEQLEFMFNGHTDTIPGFDMDIEPFKPQERGENVYGRGTCDMKAGVCAFIMAMCAIKRSGIALDRSVGFAGVIDEEERSKGTEAMLKWHYAPKHVIIGEPTSLEVCIAHKGLEWIEISCHGKSVHGSRPKEGINAIYVASQVIRRIENELAPAIESKTDPLLGCGSICVGVIAGGDDPNIVPAWTKFQIDRRYLPGETLENIYAEIERITSETAKAYDTLIEVRGLDELTASMKNLPYSLNPNDPYVEAVQSVSGKIRGKAVKPQAFPAWSDAGLLSNYSDAKCIVLGPGSIDKAHSADEFCPISEYYQACEIYYDLILKICKEEKE